MTGVMSVLYFIRYSVPFQMKTSQHFQFNFQTF